MERQVLEHVVRGSDLLKADRGDDAVRELEAANALEPGDARVMNLLGLAYFRVERYPDALAIYRDLAGRAPTDAGLHLNLGLVHLKVGQLDEAVRELQAARAIDPEEGRTLGYLGLAWARLGRYAEARDAFQQAGQVELAREMDAQLATGSVPVPSEPEAEVEAEDIVESMAVGDADAVAAAVAVADADADAVAVAVAVVEPEAVAEFTADVITDTSPLPGVPPPPDPHEIAAAAVAAITDAVSDAIAAAAADSLGVLPAPAPAPAVPRTQPTPALLQPEQPHGSLPSISTFATARLIRPDERDLPFEIGPGEALLIRVRGRLLSRRAGVVLSSGDLDYEPATKRQRGQSTREQFGPNDDPVFHLRGVGHLLVMPYGRSFAAMHLADDIVYLREDLVFAFEESLGWENGHIPGSARARAFVQLRGEGCLVVVSRRPLLSVKLAETTLHVDPGVLAGWIGRVDPRQIVLAAGTPPVVECTGEGVVLVEDLGRRLRAHE